MSSIDIVTSRRELDGLEPDWTGIVAEDDVGIEGLDATASFAWATSLIDSKLRDDDWWVLVERKGSRTTGILPLFRTARAAGNARPTEISLLQDLYGGRAGFVVRRDEPGAGARLMRAAVRELAGVGSVSFTLCEGSKSNALLEGEVGRDFLHRRPLSSQLSPYIQLPTALDSYFAGLDREFLDVLRRRTKRLHAMGNVDYSAYRDATSVPELLAAIRDVEALSWKNEAGTSITRNEHQARLYEILVPRLAEAGMLESMVIFLDGRPIAYQLGARTGDTVLGLKTSFDNALRSVAPGTIMTRAFLEHIHALGCSNFDLMGSTEAYKMKWTDRTYRRTTYRCFPRTMTGALELARSAGRSIPAVAYRRIRNRLAAIQPAGGTSPGGA